VVCTVVFGTHVVCASARVQQWSLPGARVYFLPNTASEAEYSLSGFIPTQQTNNTYIFQGVPLNFCTDIHPGVSCWELAKGTTFPQKNFFVPQTPSRRHRWKCPRRHEEKKGEKYNHLRPLNSQNTNKSLYLDLCVHTPGIVSANKDVDETFTVLLLITLLP